MRAVFIGIGALVLLVGLTLTLIGYSANLAIFASFGPGVDYGVNPALFVATISAIGLATLLYGLAPMSSTAPVKWVYENRAKGAAYPKGLRVVLAIATGVSFGFWLIAVAVHTHLNGSFSALLFSNPILLSAVSGDVAAAATGITSMVLLLSSVFALRLEKDLESAIFDTLLLGSVLTLAYEYWIWAYQNYWFYARFTILSGQADDLGGGLTNQLVAEASAAFIALNLLRRIWPRVADRSRRGEPTSRAKPG